jgi:hypothetical protein
MFWLYLQIRVEFLVYLKGMLRFCSALSLPPCRARACQPQHQLVHVGDSHLTDATAVATDTAYLY